MQQADENIEYFRNLMAGVHREGVKELMQFIEESDFYTAPASTRFHGAHAGGLLEHSINVYNCLLAKKKCQGQPWHEILADISDESIAVAALLHDLCKTGFYAIEVRKQKVNNEWVEVPVYTVSDQFPYGHGEKSVLLIEEHMKLTTEERMAIRWHMGPYSGQQDCNTLCTAMNKFPLVLALFEADMEATYLQEGK